VLPAAITLRFEHLSITPRPAGPRRRPRSAAAPTQELPLTLELVKEDGDWKIDDLG